MDKQEIEFIIKRIKKNVNILGFEDEEVRNNKKIISTACKVDNKAIRFASKDLVSNATFVFKTQGSNPDKLREVMDLYPRLLNSKELDILVVLSNFPKKFESLPTSYFNDDKYILACQESIAYHFERKVAHRKDRNCKVTEADLRNAKEVYAMVAKKIEKEKNKIAKLNLNNKKPEAQLKQIAKNIERI